MLKRDILECDIPEEVVATLLKGRSAGRNLIWATEDYAARGNLAALSPRWMQCSSPQSWSGSDRGRVLNR